MKIDAKGVGIGNHIDIEMRIYLRVCMYMCAFLGQKDETLGLGGGGCLDPAITPRRFSTYRLYMTLQDD